MLLIHTSSSIKHGEGSVRAWACMAAYGIGSVMVIDGVISDRSRRMNSGVFRTIPSAQIQLNAGKLIGWHFTVQMANEPKHTVKSTQELLKGKKWCVLE